MDLDIYRGASVWITIKTDDRTRLISQVLGTNIIKSSFNSHIFLDIDIGDFIIYDGIIYYVNNFPNIKKNSINSYDYNVTFESESYELLKTQFLDLDGNSDFHLMGNLETFIDLIVTNMNREHTGWVKGTCDQTNADYKLLSFKKTNCMQVLQRLCNEFEGEFYFEFSFDFVEGAKLPYISADSAVIGYKPADEAEHVYRPAEAEITNYTKDICFTDKAGEDSGYTFLYKQGLRNIHKTTLSEKNIITRLYAFGSRKNLKSDYRDYSRRLKFVSDGESYLEKNVDKYGTIEHTEIFEDIYPHREGTISAVDGADVKKFSDSGMDFNLNDYLLPGITAKLHFNSGNLGGYEFEVSSYNNSTKEFTIIAFSDDQGYVMPNATLKPAIGDKYVLIDIFMPQGYIDTAETALEAKAQAYLDDNSEPRVTYILDPDPRYFETHFIDLKAGDFVTIQDTVLGIDVMTRIVELTKSVANQYKYTLKLTDHLEVQLIQRLYSGQENIKEKIEIGEGGDVIRARRSWRTSEELRTMVYDTDGYFDMGNIRPLSIETGMLSVGSKSTQFILKEIQVEGNYTGDKTKFYASAGELIHLSIADEIRTWTLSENTQDSLVDETPYYIYAKCTKEPGYTGQIVVDDTQRKFDDDATYYYFLIGVLHSVDAGLRGISLTYGQTIINGKFISTGSITADEIAANAITTIKLDALAITAGKIAAGAIETDKLDALAIIAGKIAANAIETDKLDALAVTADKIAANAITAVKINANAVETDKLNALAVTAEKIAANAITAVKINANAIETDKINAGAVTAGKITVTSLAAITATLGSVVAGNIRTTRFQVGGGTDEDIYFEDSGVRMYDAGGRVINIYKSGYKTLQLALGSTANVVSSLDGILQLSGNTDIQLWAASKVSYFRSTGQLKLPTQSAAPGSPTVGDIACDEEGVLHDYWIDTWVKLTGVEGW